MHVRPEASASFAAVNLHSSRSAQSEQHEREYSLEIANERCGAECMLHTTAMVG